MSFSGRRRFSQYWAGNPSNSSFGFSSAEIQRSIRHKREFSGVSAKVSHSQNSYSPPKGRPKSAPRMRKYEGFSPQPASTPRQDSSEVYESSPTAPHTVQAHQQGWEFEFVSPQRKAFLRDVQGDYHTFYNYKVDEPDNQGGPESSNDDRNGQRPAQAKKSPRPASGQQEVGRPKGIAADVYEQWTAVAEKRRILHDSKMRLRESQMKLQTDEERLIKGRKQLQEQAELVERERDQLRKEREALQRDGPVQREELEKLRVERQTAAAMVEAISNERRQLCQERMRIEEELAKFQREVDNSGSVVVREKVFAGLN